MVALGGQAMSSGERKGGKQEADLDEALGAVGKLSVDEQKTLQESIEYVVRSLWDR